MNVNDRGAAEVVRRFFRKFIPVYAFTTLLTNFPRGQDIHSADLATYIHRIMPLLHLTRWHLPERMHFAYQ